MEQKEIILDILNLVLEDSEEKVSSFEELSDENYLLRLINKM